MLNEEQKEKLEKLLQDLDEEKPPTSIKEAENSIKLNLILYVQMFVDEEFSYHHWKDGPKNKFDSAREKIISRLLAELQGNQLPIIQEKATGSAFDFEPIEIKEDVKTLEEYLEMKI